MNRITRSMAFFTLWMFFLLPILLIGASATSPEEIDYEEKTEQCLNDSNEMMIAMSNDGFSIVRMNDTINEALETYEIQSLLRENDKSYDLSKALQYCESAVLIHKSAYEARDEYLALKRFYDESFEESVNTSSVDAMIKDIEENIDNERYENVAPMVEKAYGEIINIQSSNTAVRLFYSSTSKGLKTFFYTNWKTIAIFSFGILVLLLIYRIKIATWIIKRKILRLELRKKTIKGTIMQTQKDYFNQGKMPEGIYNIRTKRFAESIRDLERQIPLLHEELARLERRRK